MEETDVNPARKACLEEHGQGDECRFGAGLDAPGEDVMVWGDPTPTP
ncbi:hypothetical protein ACRAWD_13140 [Caulobacter segnis]